MRSYAKTTASQEQRNQLIGEHLDVARRIALRVARRVPEWIAIEDLIAAAMVGLAEAADRYDANRGEPFVGFAEKRIRGAVLDELRRGDIMPRRLRSTARRIGATIQSLEQRLGRAPEDKEVATELGVSEAEYLDDLKMLNHVSLVDMESLTGAVCDIHGVDDAGSPAYQAERAELVRRVAEALPRLQERDALILSLYYNEEFTYAEIGSLLGVSESRVCQLHSRALVRLRAEIEEPGRAKKRGCKRARSADRK